MSKLEEFLAGLPSDQLEAATAALDLVSEPMSPREIELALLPSGLSRKHRRELVMALKGLAIIVIRKP